MLHQAGFSGFKRLRRGAGHDWDEIIHNTDDFDEVGIAFERSIGYQPSRVGQAESRLLPMRDLVEFAIDWMRENR